MGKKHTLNAHWWLVEKQEEDWKECGDEDFLDYIDDPQELKRKKVKDNISEYGDEEY